MPVRRGPFKIDLMKSNLFRINLRYFKCLLFVGIFCCTGVIAAESLVEIKVPVASQKPDRAQARQEMLEQAVLQVSHQYIQDLIGVQKMERNHGLIKNKIIKNSGKYILFLKEVAPQYADTQSSMTVEMKISVRNLEALLLEEGLLYKTEGPPKILPLVAFSDAIRTSNFSWWVSSSEEKVHLREMALLFHERLRRDLREVGFFGLNPSTGLYLDLLPNRFKTDNLASDDYLQVGELFQAAIVVRGSVSLSAVRDRSQVYRLEWKLSAIHSGNGRVIGEVVRSFDTDSGPEAVVVARKVQEVLPSVCADLSAQVVEAWRSGTFGATLLKLTLRGDIDYPLLTQFKKTVSDQVKEIKVLKERLFGPGQVVFELDSSVGPEQLAQVLESRSFQTFRIQLESKGPEGLIFKLRHL